MIHNNTDNITNVTFITVDQVTFTIELDKINRYPDSYLQSIVDMCLFVNNYSQQNQVVNNNVRKDKYIKIPIYAKSITTIKHFFNNGKWINPYMYDGELEIVGITCNFYESCDFLGLPCEYHEPDTSDEIYKNIYDDLCSNFNNKIMSNQYNNKCKNFVNNNFNNKMTFDYHINKHNEFMNNDYTDDDCDMSPCG